VRDFADRLRRFREAKGITQYRLAQLSGLSKEGISKLEEGATDPRLSTLQKLAAALGVPVARLVADRLPAGRPPAEPDAVDREAERRARAWLLRLLEEGEPMDLSGPAPAPKRRRKN
jgi:transcriptional regulator with XRE-family HTH domain